MRVRTFVKNDSEDTKQTLLKSIILEQSGQEIAVMVAEETILSGHCFEFDQMSPILSHPKLWSPDEPNLYKVITIVMDDGQLVDRYESPLGASACHKRMNHPQAQCLRCQMSRRAFAVMWINPSTVILQADI